MPKKKLRTSESLQSAISDIKNGIYCIRKAGEFYGIPESTIRRRMKNGLMNSPRVGRKPTFSEEQEKILKNHLTNAANNYHGLTARQCRKLTFELAEKLNIRHSFKKDQALAGKKWLKLFLLRIKSLSIRKPEATSAHRVNLMKLKLTYFLII